MSEQNELPRLKPWYPQVRLRRILFTPFHPRLKPWFSRIENKKIGVGFGIMLLKDKKILLGKRHYDVKKADSKLHGEGTWTMPGGKLHFGETFEQGAKREVLEETGIKIGENKVISISNDIVSDTHFVTIGFLCEDFDGEPKVMEPDEITEWKWFMLDNLPQPIFFHRKRF